MEQHDHAAELYEQQQEEGGDDVVLEMPRLRRGKHLDFDFDLGLDLELDLGLDLGLDLPACDPGTTSFCDPAGCGDDISSFLAVAGEEGETRSGHSDPRQPHYKEDSPQETPPQPYFPPFSSFPPSFQHQHQHQHQHQQERPCDEEGDFRLDTLGTAAPVYAHAYAYDWVDVCTEDWFLVDEEEPEGGGVRGVAGGGEQDEDDKQEGGLRGVGGDHDDWL
jgi:hypothetical protein